MTFYDIFIQAIGLIPSVICFLALQSGNRKRILILQLFCCLMWIAHYSFLGGYTAVLVNFVGMFRAVLCYFNDKPRMQSKGFLYLLIFLYMGSSIVTWQGLHSLLPSIAMILTTIALWTHKMRLTRILFVLNSPPLFAYNLIVGSYSCAVIELCAFISFIIAVYRFDIKAPKNDYEQAE